MKARAWPLFAIGALFAGPFVVALLLYAGRGSFGGFEQLPNPDRELLASPPAIPLAPLRLADGRETEPGWARSRWSLIYARMRPCEVGCLDALGRLHEVYLALGSERDRVRLVLLVPASAGSTRVPADFLLGILAAPGGDELVRVFGPERLEEGRYFVVDPLGNVILSYPDDADQGRLLQDLERLLEFSRVG